MFDYLEKAFHYRRQVSDPSDAQFLQCFESIVTKFNVKAMEQLSRGLFLESRLSGILRLIRVSLFLLLVLVENYALSLDLLRKADLLTKHVGAVGNDTLRLRLRAVTLNNYGCYYKR
jgi:hypothetical protein